MPNERLQSLLMFVAENPAAIAMFDRQMRYLAVSRRWIADYGLEQDLIGRDHYEVFPEIPETWKAVHRHALAGETVAAEHDIFHRQDGTVQWLQWMASPWFDARGEVGGILISTHAIDEETAEDGSRRADDDTADPRFGAPLASPRRARTAEQREIVAELREANLILNNLPPALFECLADELVPVQLSPDTVLAEPLHRVDRVYFPLDGLNAMFRHLEDGTGAAVV